jgi:hypothetical protein
VWVERISVMIAAAARKIDVGFFLLTVARRHTVAHTAALGQTAVLYCSFVKCKYTGMQYNVL